ncbi:MAG: cupin-like domain-containing protein [Porticoccaceae bacterium]|nr:cupin-like domain-containing protein [Porticoccaceae bacterium]
MLEIKKTIKEVSGCTPSSIPATVLTSTQPLVLRGLVSDWPITKLAEQSPQKATDYLLQFYQDRPVTVSLGDPSTAGRVFYNEHFTGFNFQSFNASMRELVEKIFASAEDTSPPMIYMASTMVDHWLPGFRKDNDLAIPDSDPLVSIWMGNKTRIAAHYDLPDNIACSVVGRRRFTLFPPDQLANLYPGPLDWAPGGQSVSLVDFHQPDYQQYPKFADALATAQVAELGPGDGIFIPSMWWHHVEALDSLNVLINYWWRQSPAYMNAPINALQLALMTVRDLPPEQKKVWQGMFEHYVFNEDNNAHKHIPQQALGSLAPMDEAQARKLRALLRNKLS